MLAQTKVSQKAETSGKRMVWELVYETVYSREQKRELDLVQLLDIQLVQMLALWMVERMVQM